MASTPSDDRPARAAPDILQNTEERFRLLVETVTDYAIFLLDAEGHVLTWNTGAQRIKGYEAHEIVGRHFSQFYPPDVVQRGWPAEELRQAARQGHFEDEGWRLRKDGSRFWANVVITALRDRKGVLQGFAKITRDLTERRAQEEALRRSEERLRLVIEAVVDYAIFMLDANGYVMSWNIGAQHIKGYRAEEIVGRHFSCFYPDDQQRGGWPDHALREAAEKGRFEDEGWRIRKDGSRFWANAVITALRDAEGHLHGYSKITRDLTDRKQAEALLEHGARREELLEAERNARVEAQRAAQMKDEFLATLSHELRTPLNAILGWAQVLTRNQALSPEDLKRGTEAIERNARAQVQLIDELLDLSRIMAGRVRLDVQRLMLATVAEAAVESVEPAAAAKNIRLEKVLDPQAGPVSGDPARLQQVIWNLLSNAIKFTPKGGRVQVLLERVNSHVELTVADTGIGIPAEFLPRVFDRFSQNDASASRSYGGLGLGLAIAKQLVELHGGTLSASSAGENRGATFVIKLPLSIVLPSNPPEERLHPAHHTATEISLLPMLTGLRLLVVDDEPDARDLARRVLEGQGATVLAASSAEEALSTLESQAIDVLLSDIGMPGMDGYQLMRRVRSSDAAYRRIPSVALTAFARSEDRKKAILAGYHSHISKPVDIAELVIVVASLIDRADVT
ncbi:MAG: PAS domain S-box protein [Betaproteobacteria bacterium]|nr:PAS domain S-box protein [Betaproteobacteria bacterium]